MSNKSNLLGPTASDEDVWDDTELIREYDKAVKGWRKSRDSSAKESPSESEGASGGGAPLPGPWTTVSSDCKVDGDLTIGNGNDSLSQEVSHGWAIGSPCRAIYSGDNHEYEAKIVDLKWPVCTVRFVGYGNEEKSSILFLKPSKGKMFRDQQRRDAVEYRRNLNGGRLEVADLADCYSMVSLSSSMTNNYGDSVLCREDMDETLPALAQSRNPLSASTPNPKSQILKSNLKVLETLEIPNKIPPPVNQPLEDAIDGASAIPPSAAEATIASSSTSDLSSVDDDPAQENPPNLPTSNSNGQWENFNNTMPNMPHFSFPVPPLPLTFANSDGGFDFGRGELPSLLMSWYMAGYQSGFFDAKREFASAQQNRSGSGGRKKKN